MLLPAVSWARPHGKHAARDQVTMLENAWVKAYLAGDATAMDKLLSPDYLGITAAGDVLTKAQQLDRIRDRSIAFNALQISDVRVKLISVHAASVTCMAQLQGTSDGRPLSGNFRYTHVYQRMTNGTWAITNFEATRIQRPGAGVSDETGKKTGADVSD